MQNKTTEDYLKHIYWLSRLGKKITTKSIADRMGIRSASVTDMIKKLTQRGYLAYEPYYGVKLNLKGEKIAIKVIRRHRLIESFLVDALGYSWDKVHEEAERMEHVISDEMENRIDKYLGYPKFDPHGDPIPTHEGILHEQPNRSLTDMKVGETAVIQRVLDSESLLNYAGRIDIVLGTKVKMIHKEEFDGSLEIRINGDKVQRLSRKAADSIFVDSVVRGKNK